MSLATGCHLPGLPGSPGVLSRCRKKPKVWPAITRQDFVSFLNEPLAPKLEAAAGGVSGLDFFSCGHSVNGQRSVVVRCIDYLDCDFDRGDPVRLVWLLAAANLDFGFRRPANSICVLLAGFRPKAGSPEDPPQVRLSAAGYSRTPQRKERSGALSQKATSFATALASKPMLLFTSFRLS